MYKGDPSSFLAQKKKFTHSLMSFILLASTQAFTATALIQYLSLNPTEVRARFWASIHDSRSSEQSLYEC